jgi:hypothetical protein
MTYQDHDAAPVTIANADGEVTAVDIVKMAKQVDELHGIVTSLMKNLGSAIQGPGMQGAMMRQMLPPNVVSMFPQE